MIQKMIVEYFVVFVVDLNYTVRASMNCGGVQYDSHRQIAYPQENTQFAYSGNAIIEFFYNSS